MARSFIPAAPGSSVDIRLRAIEDGLKKVADLAESALIIGPNQRSPVLGELIAGRITTPLPSGQPSMTLDLLRSGAGLGPILNVSDGTFNRVQAGNLADYVGPNGVDSPAQYGFRAVDASGNAIFDSLGLIAVLTVLGSKTNISQGSTAGNSGWQAAAGTQVSFTLTRKVSILVLGAAFVYDPLFNDTGFDLAATMLIDGAQVASQSPVFDNLTGALSTTPFAIAALASGAHTAAIGVNQTTGHNWAMSNAYVFVLGLGA